MEQTKELVTNKDPEQFKQELNLVTGYEPPKTTPSLKFKVKEGRFCVTTGELNEDGVQGEEKIKEEEINVHIIVANIKKIATRFKSKTATVQVTTDEMPSGERFITLKDSDGNIVDTGEYKALQAEHPEYDLGYTQIVYLYYNDIAYKMYIGGSALTNFFPYLKLGNPAFVETTFKVGAKSKNDYGEDNYALEIKKGKPLDQDMIVDRTNEVIAYLKVIKSQVRPVEQKKQEEFVKLGENGLETEEQMPIAI